MHKLARFRADDREDSAAPPAPVFHEAGTFQPPSASTDMNGNQTKRTTAATRNRSSDFATAVPGEAERVA
jgi:hypothetical protein